MSVVIDYWLRPNDPLLGLGPKQFLPKLTRANCFSGGLCLADKLYVYISEGRPQGRRHCVYAVSGYDLELGQQQWRQRFDSLNQALDYCAKLGQLKPGAHKPTNTGQMCNTEAISA
ncbi:MAG: hypothetical protein OIF38_09270 [Cellvibrionaceae bacterium]|nr:hypothetical protein [Cellvibrionaceae bacterium]